MRHAVPLLVCVLIFDAILLWHHDLSLRVLVHHLSELRQYPFNLVFIALLHIAVGAITLVEAVEEELKSKQ